MRSPLTYPQPGDVVKWGVDRVTVIDVADGLVKYTEDGHSYRISIALWKVWMECAEVIHTAEGGA
jgi:hypothetical protein